LKSALKTPPEIYAKIGNQGEPYGEYWNNNWSPIDLPAGETVVVDQTFTMSDPSTAQEEFAFHMGGDLAQNLPNKICFDNIVLWDDQYTAQPTPEPGYTPDVRLNQVGYYPDAIKRATYINASNSALNWSLRDSSGTAVLSGITTVFGQDGASGDHVHIADFSSYAQSGTNFTLDVNGNISHPFDISSNIYGQLKRDALAYFYHNRSGIAIEMPYAGREDLARPAGHPSDVVTCENVDYSCDYYLDVTGGWYDAGDHGKYVVNGGISVWTMMNQYERSLHWGDTDYAFGDGSMSIPENSNGVPDILDEARWQMKFMLAMQIPDGKPNEGMVHHKMHDLAWTPLATAPHEDEQERILRGPSTAATLNVAATGAQCARIWATIDPAFSAQCLTAAEKAWNAAVANPAIYAPEHAIGGGPYNDSKVQDEFYWAAAELYTATGKETYKTYLQNSPFYLVMPSVFGEESSDAGLDGVFTWASTQGLGTVTLATVPNSLPTADVTQARNNIASAADHFIDSVIPTQGYGIPLNNNANGYPWGSNSFVLNEMLVMGLAHDFTNNSKYLDGMTESMDYILGRNPLDKSFITGYGEKPLENPHHRFWAYQSNPAYPKAPAGTVSGGPNSGLQDPWVQGAGLEGCAPQKCFLDHIEAWSTNEITINWNSPLAWVVAYMDEAYNGDTTPVTPVPPTATTDVTTVPPTETPVTPIPPTATATTPVTPVPPTATIPGVTITPDPSAVLKVQYQVGDSSATDNAIKPNLRIVNNGTTAVSLNQLTMRYWFTENAPGFNYFCDYAQVNCSTITGQVVSAGGNDYYVEIGFTSGAGSVAAGKNSGTIKSRINSTNWANLDETNDYSYDASKSSYADWNQVTLYLNGALVWGVEPDGSVVPTATATVTSQPPTATATATTPVTPIPPTATATATAVPPTATPVVGASCSVNYVITNQWGNGFQANVTITNSASSAVQGYTLTWDFLNGETINDGWNATFSQSGTTATVSNSAGYWNGTIGANGGTSSFGFTGNHNGTVTAPTNFSLNGTPCN
jgi:endoglucanase